VPGGKTLITLQGTAPNQNFFRLDLETGEQRQLTSFDPKSGSMIQSFDISPDGKRIVFRSIAKSRRHCLDESGPLADGAHHTAPPGCRRFASHVPSHRLCAVRSSTVVERLDGACEVASDDARAVGGR
jgi:hypothetical protein